MVVEKASFPLRCTVFSSTLSLSYPTMMASAAASEPGDELKLSIETTELAGLRDSPNDGGYTPAATKTDSFKIKVVHKALLVYHGAFLYPNRPPTSRRHPLKLMYFNCTNRN